MLNMRETLENMKEFQEKVGHTPEELDFMWNYCLENKHALIMQLDRCGKNWRDMNLHCVSTLEKTYKKLKEKVEAERGENGNT